MSKDLTRVEEILASYDYEPHHLIAIMQASRASTSISARICCV